MRTARSSPFSPLDRDPSLGQWPPGQRPPAPHGETPLDRDPRTETPSCPPPGTGQRHPLDRDLPQRNMGPETAPPPSKEHGTKQPDRKWHHRLPPWTERQTGKYITLPQTSFRLREVKTECSFVILPESTGKSLIAKIRLIVSVVNLFALGKWPFNISF